MKSVSAIFLVIAALVALNLASPVPKTDDNEVNVERVHRQMRADKGNLPQTEMDVFTTKAATPNGNGGSNGNSGSNNNNGLTLPGLPTQLNPLNNFAALLVNAYPSIFGSNNPGALPFGGSPGSVSTQLPTAQSANGPLGTTFPNNYYNMLNTLPNIPATPYPLGNFFAGNGAFPVPPAPSGLTDLDNTPNQLQSLGQLFNLANIPQFGGLGGLSGPGAPGPLDGPAGPSGGFNGAPGSGPFGLLNLNRIMSSALPFTPTMTGYYTQMRLSPAY